MPLEWMVMVLYCTLANLAIERYLHNGLFIGFHNLCAHRWLCATASSNHILHNKGMFPVLRKVNA